MVRESVWPVSDTEKINDRRTGVSVKPTVQGRAAGQKEFEFTANDFERVRALIYRRAGIALADSKQEMVYSRLARRLRTKGEISFAVYLDALEKNQDAEEWEAFTNALTTNLTSFFREEHHFPLLSEHVRRRAGPGAGGGAAGAAGGGPGAGA